MKSELRKIVLKYKQENCDKFGNVSDNNLSETEMKKHEKLENKNKEGRFDKTGRMTLDTIENVTKKMEKLVRNDKVIDVKKVKTLENKLNSHMEWWVKILQPGQRNNQAKRVKSNLITKDNQIPILRGTSMDHKESLDKEIGPDLRPIMGAIVGPNIAAFTPSKISI